MDSPGDTSRDRTDLRKRPVKADINKGDEAQTHTKDADTAKDTTDISTSVDNIAIGKGSYWLTRILLIRYLGFIYFVAFLVALNQNKELIGSKGLLPADKFLDGVKGRTGGINMNTYTMVPSIFWLFDYNSNLDQLMDYVAYAGLGLASFLMINGGANWIIMLTLWILYHSLVNIGQRWYGFGWESQLLETGFLSIFLCPMLHTSRVPRATPTSQIVLWGYRWLIFRIMIGAGMIKIRGDQCWRDLTCMNYHYETQPVPNPMSYFMHQSPEAWHKFETLSNHIVELITPSLLIIPYLRIPKMIGGAIQILFQVILITSGNLSFLNWLTILPNLACFDDASLALLFTESTLKKVAKVEKDKPTLNAGNYVRKVFNVSLGILIAYLSIPVVQNLLSSRQHMNTSFDPIRLVNTYGAFGSITKERTEVIYQGTYGDPRQAGTKWEEYEFKCKPGKISRRPCVISPYHYRLDWLLWFAAFQNYQYNPWLISLAHKMLINDNSTLSLIAHNPFDGRDPPKFVRVQHYRYQFAKVGSKDASEGRWWKRRLIGEYMPAISRETAVDVLRQMQLDGPPRKKTKKKNA